MSIQLMTAVWQHSKASGGVLIVGLAIADFSNDEGLAFPSITTLAKKARLSPRQVKRALQRLMQLGELAIVKNQGPRGVNLYRLLLGDKLSRGVTSATARGDIRDRKGVSSVTPNPSEEEPSKNLRGDSVTQNGKLRPTIPAVATHRPTPYPPKIDPIARGQWKQAYGDPKQYGYE